MNEMRTRRRNRPWSAKEDSALLSAVQAHGTHRWDLVVGRVTGRSKSQCRDRWANHVNPKIVKGNWSDEEDAKIISMVQTKGRKWAEMAKALPGRPPLLIKRRYDFVLQTRAAMLQRQSTTWQSLQFATSRPYGRRDQVVNFLVKLKNGTTEELMTPDRAVRDTSGTTIHDKGRLYSSLGRVDCKFTGTRWNNETYRIDGTSDFARAVPGMTDMTFCQDTTLSMIYPPSLKTIPTTKSASKLASIYSPRHSCADPQKASAMKRIGAARHAACRPNHGDTLSATKPEVLLAGRYGYDNVAGFGAGTARSIDRSAPPVYVLTHDDDDVVPLVVKSNGLAFAAAP